MGKRSAAKLVLLRGAQTVGAIWASPLTLAGVVAGVLAMPLGARARISDGALVFHRFPLGPGGALTLGNVILHTGDTLDSVCVTYAHSAGLAQEPAIVIADHERAHVLQYMALGPLFLPLYFLCGGISVHNPFEHAADRYAMSGRDWWPWARPTNGRPD